MLKKIKLISTSGYKSRISVERFRGNIRNACRNYTDLPPAVRAAIALQSGGTSELCGLAN